MTKPIVNEILSYTFQPHAWPLDLSHELETESYVTLPNGKTLSSSVLKHVYPELALWRPQQVVAAMKQYFSDVYYTDWIEMENLREGEFLAWLYDYQEKQATENKACLTHADLVNGTLDRVAEIVWTSYSSGHLIEHPVVQDVLSDKTASVK